MSAPLEPGDELLVTAQPARRHEVSRLGWAALIAVALGLTAVAILVLGLLVRTTRAEHERAELACQVERLGGQPIGGVRCPPSVKATVPTPAASAQRPPEVIVVFPPGSSPPAPAASAAPHRTGPARASSPPPGPSPTASPRPRATPSPSPLVQICPPGLPCWPRTLPPRP